MKKPVKGNIIWEDSEKKEKPIFTPDPNGEYNMFYFEEDGSTVYTKDRI